MAYGRQDFKDEDNFPDDLCLDCGEEWDSCQCVISDLDFDDVDDFDDEYDFDDEPSKEDDDE